MKDKRGVKQGIPSFLNNKKAVSGVVTAVLLILLTISAVAVLWVVISSFVSNQTSGIGDSTGCLDTKLRIAAATKELSFVNPNTLQYVSVQRVSGNSPIKEIIVYSNDEIIGGLLSTEDDSKGGSNIPVGNITRINLGIGILEEGDNVTVAAKIGDQICSKSEKVEYIYFPDSF